MYVYVDRNAAAGVPLRDAIVGPPGKLPPHTSSHLIQAPASYMKQASVLFNLRNPMDLLF